MAKSRFALAVTGNLKQENEKTKLAYLQGNKAAVERVGIIGKGRLREDVIKAGMGQRLANSWRYQAYPGGKRLANNPASLLYSRAPRLILIHESATTIVAKNRKYLAIPTDNVPIQRRDRAGRFRGRLSPEEVESRFNRDLIFVQGKGGKAYLFLDRTRARTAKTRRRKRGKGSRRKFVLMFVLTRQVHLRQRLNPRRILEQLSRDWPRIHMEALNTHLAIALR